MKISPNKNNQAGLTLIEVLVILGILAVFAGMIGVTTERDKARARRIQCLSNLKQIGIGHREFANDHGGEFPNELLQKEGGSMELLATGNAAGHFQLLEVSRKVFVCPCDSRSAGKDFSVALNSSNLSYFACADSRTNLADSFLSGDRNVTRDGNPLLPGRSVIRTNDVLGWTKALHDTKGNVGLSDGSVQQATERKFNEAFQSSKTNISLILP